MGKKVGLFCFRASFSHTQNLQYPAHKGYGSLFTSLIFERAIVFIEKLCRLVTKFFVLFAEIKISL